MKQFWRLTLLWLCMMTFPGCLHPNFMTGGATDQQYTAGFDLAIDREQRGLPPSGKDQTWNSYWCQIIQSIDSPPASGQKRRLKRYLIEKRRAFKLKELDCR